jgi:hypothetical protein
MNNIVMFWHKIRGFFLYSKHMKSKLSIVTFGFIMVIIAACNQNNAIPQKENKIMQVKVVSLEKCSATQPTIALVKETAGEMGISINFVHIVVNTTEEAYEHRHIGSPTVQINGLDIDPLARDITQFGIT